MCAVALLTGCWLLFRIDSLDGINILFALESEFDVDIPDDAAKKIRSVREMTDGIAQLINLKQQALKQQAT